MNEIVIDARDYCSHAKSRADKPLGDFTVSVIPSRSTFSDRENCPVGNGVLSLEILGDRYIEPVGDVKLCCSGCETRPEGIQVVSKRFIL